MNLSNAILFATLVLPIGFTNAVRVLAAQSYGAGQAKNVGLWVQVGSGALGDSLSDSDFVGLALCG
jgi:Na+-driven multidrug efflux pump